MTDKRADTRRLYLRFHSEILRQNTQYLSPLYGLIINGIFISRSEVWHVNYSQKVHSFQLASWLTVLPRIKTSFKASWGLQSTQIASRLQFHIMSCEANVHLPPRPSQQSLMSHTVLKCLTRVWLFKFCFIVKENSFSSVPLSLAMIISSRIRVCGCMLPMRGWEAAFSINPEDKILPLNDNAQPSTV